MQISLSSNHTTTIITIIEDFENQIANSCQNWKVWLSHWFIINLKINSLTFSHYTVIIPPALPRQILLGR